MDKVFNSLQTVLLLKEQGKDMVDAWPFPYCFSAVTLSALHRQTEEYVGLGCE